MLKSNSSKCGSISASCCFNDSWCFWVLKCVEPYSQWNGFFCCAKYVSLFSDIRIYSSHLLLLSFLDSVFFVSPLFSAFVFWYFLSFSLYFSILFILRSFLLAKVFPDCHCCILFEFDQRHSYLHTFNVYSYFFSFFSFSLCPAFWREVFWLAIYHIRPLVFCATTVYIVCSVVLSMLDSILSLTFSVVLPMSDLLKPTSVIWRILLLPF